MYIFILTSFFFPPRCGPPGTERGRWGSYVPHHYINARGPGEIQSTSNHRPYRQRFRQYRHQISWRIGWFPFPFLMYQYWRCVCASFHIVKGVCGVFCFVCFFFRHSRVQHALGLGGRDSRLDTVSHPQSLQTHHLAAPGSPWGHAGPERGANPWGRVWSCPHPRGNSGDHRPRSAYTTVVKLFIIDLF